RSRGAAVLRTDAGHRRPPTTAPASEDPAIRASANSKRTVGTVSDSSARSPRRSPSSRMFAAGQRVDSTLTHQGIRDPPDPTSPPTETLRSVERSFLAFLNVRSWVSVVLPDRKSVV